MKWVNHIEEVISLVCLVIMTVIIIVQVIFRYFIGFSLTWPDELARYAFIYTTYIGISYVELKERHLAITTLRTYSSKSMKKVIRIIAYIISIIICLILTWWGIGMVEFVKITNQDSPYLRFPMYWVYYCLPIGFGCTSIRTFVNLYNYIRTMNIRENPI